MIVITTMDVLPDYCYDCPCHDGEHSRCKADKEKRSIIEYRPYWCPLKEIHDDQDPLELENVQQLKANVIALLKEHEPRYPVCEKCGKKIDHIITSVFNYDGSESEYSFPITYNKDSGYVRFSITTQKWTGFELSDTEQKESIRCPFCGEFPFNANEKIKFCEPEEVVVMMRESR